MSSWYAVFLRSSASWEYGVVSWRLIVWFWAFDFGFDMTA